MKKESICLNKQVYHIIYMQNYTKNSLIYLCYPALCQEHFVQYKIVALICKSTICHYIVQNQI